ncbi:hypothetical protein LBMAG15_19120 [Actinomycetes bacterium]|nr:hypothetical protein LBMAG15_19120 [Actinomycetes bacterium]
MSSNSIGALLGLLIAAGLLLVVSRLGATRKLRMAERIAPYVGCRDPRQDEQSAVGALLVLLKPRLLSGRGDLALSLRLGRAGRGGELDRYRFDQVTFAAGGVIAGGALGLVLIAKGAPAIGVVLLAVFGAIGGVLVADRRLAKQGKARQRRIGQQLPTIAELLAFAVAAGESPVVALERVASTTTGDLSDEIRVSIADLHSGSTLDQALRGVADRTGSPDVERFVDGLIVSLERGTPLAEVLRAQAADARAADRRALMELAGRKDVAMLIPVVFFILPTVVLIALFPGIRSLQLVVP